VQGWNLYINTPEDFQINGAIYPDEYRQHQGEWSVWSAQTDADTNITDWHYTWTPVTPDASFHHIAIVYDEAANINFYVDCVLKTSDPVLGNIATQQSRDFTVGKNSFGDGFPYDATTVMDWGEMNFYGRTFSTVELQKYCMQCQ